MPHFDMPLDELRRYAPDLVEPVDLDAFLTATLAETRAHDLDPVFERALDAQGWAERMLRIPHRCAVGTMLRLRIGEAVGPAS